MGLHFHTTIAASLDGVVLVQVHEAGQKEPEACDQGQESYKWIEGMEAAWAAFDGLGFT